MKTFLLLFFKKEDFLAFAFLLVPAPFPDRVLDPDLDIEEVLFVAGHDDAAVGFRDGGDDGVECASRATLGFIAGHEPRPNQGGFLVGRILSNATEAHDVAQRLETV